MTNPEEDFEVPFGSTTYRGRSSIPPRRFKRRAIVEAGKVFSRGRSVDDWRRRVAELRIANLGNWNVIEETVERRLGVVPDAGDAGNIEQAEAWALCAFAHWDHEVQSLLGRRAQGVLREEDLAVVDQEIVRCSVLLGRLMEWWCWRSEGHDRRAAGKRRSEELGLPRGRQSALDARKFEAANWHEDARQRAAERRRQHPTWSPWRIAGEIAPKLGRSQRRVFDAIKSLWPKMG